MEFVRYAVESRVGYITLSRPDKKNALNHLFVSELKTIFKKVEEDTNVKIIVLKAEGSAFCAGADLEYLQSLQQFSYEQNLQDSIHLMELYKLIYQLKKVVIAQVQGYALAGGCGLVSVCDFVFCSPEANFGYTEARIGFVPAIVMVFLIRKIGEAKAKELMLMGNILTASKALELGIVNWVIEESKIEEAVNSFAQQLCVSNSEQSMMLIKKMVAEVQSLSLDDALRYACEKNAEARNSEDCKRGIASFLNKEKLCW